MSGPAAPDAWTLAAEGTADGVRITLAVLAQDVAAIVLDRAFARGLLAAAGDATERTFPRPPEASDG